MKARISLLTALFLVALAAPAADFREINAAIKKMLSPVSDSKILEGATEEGWLCKVEFQSGQSDEGYSWMRTTIRTYDERDQVLEYVTMSALGAQVVKEYKKDEHSIVLHTREKAEFQNRRGEDGRLRIVERGGRPVLVAVESRTSWFTVGGYFTPFRGIQCLINKRPEYPGLIQQIPRGDRTIIRAVPLDVNAAVFNMNFSGKWVPTLVNEVWVINFRGRRCEVHRYRETKPGWFRKVSSNTFKDQDCDMYRTIQSSKCEAAAGGAPPDAEAGAGSPELKE